MPYATTLTEDNVNEVADIGNKEGDDDVFEKMNIDEYQGDEGDLSSVSSVLMTDSSTVSESEYDISAGTLARVGTYDENIDTLKFLTFLLG